MYNYKTDNGIVLFNIGNKPKQLEADTIYFQIIAFKPNTNKYYTEYWFQVETFTISKIVNDCSNGNYDKVLKLYDGIKDFFTNNTPDYLKNFILVCLCNQFTPFIITT